MPAAPSVVRPGFRLQHQFQLSSQILGNSCAVIRPLRPLLLCTLRRRFAAALPPTLRYSGRHLAMSISSLGNVRDPYRACLLPALRFTYRPMGCCNVVTPGARSTHTEIQPLAVVGAAGASAGGAGTLPAVSRHAVLAGAAAAVGRACCRWCRRCCTGPHGRSPAARRTGGTWIGPCRAWQGP